jgi:hypothetical protein
VERKAILHFYSTQKHTLRPFSFRFFQIKNVEKIRNPEEVSEVCIYFLYLKGKGKKSSSVTNFLTKKFFLCQEIEVNTYA